VGPATDSSAASTMYFVWASICESRAHKFQSPSNSKLGAVLNLVNNLAAENSPSLSIPLSGLDGLESSQL
jgi:hypothetical protein